MDEEEAGRDLEIGPARPMRREGREGHPGEAGEAGAGDDRAIHAGKLPDSAGFAKVNRCGGLALPL